MSELGSWFDESTAETEGEEWGDVPDHLFVPAPEQVPPNVGISSVPASVPEPVQVSPKAVTSSSAFVPASAPVQVPPKVETTAASVLYVDPISGDSLGLMLYVREKGLNVDFKTISTIAGEHTQARLRSIGPTYASSPIQLLRNDRRLIAGLVPDAESGTNGHSSARW